LRSQIFFPLVPTSPRMDTCPPEDQDTRDGCGRVCVAAFRPYRAAVCLCGLSQGCALGYDMAPFQGLVPEKIPGPNGARQPGPGQSPGNAVQPKLQKPRRGEISSAQGNALGPSGPRIQALKERNSAMPLKRGLARPVRLPDRGRQQG
jgi:hypothetical protein